MKGGSGRTTLRMGVMIGTSLRGRGRMSRKSLDPSCLGALVWFTPAGLPCDERDRLGSGTNQAGTG